MEIRIPYRLWAALNILGWTVLGVVYLRWADDEQLGYAFLAVAAFGLIMMFIPPRLVRAVAEWSPSKDPDDYR